MDRLSLAHSDLTNAFQSATRFPDRAVVTIGDPAFVVKPMTVAIAVRPESVRKTLRWTECGSAKAPPGRGRMWLPISKHCRNQPLIEPTKLIGRPKDLVDACGRARWILR